MSLTPRYRVVRRPAREDEPGEYAYRILRTHERPDGSIQRWDRPRVPEGSTLGDLLQCLEELKAALKAPVLDLWELVENKTRPHPIEAFVEEEESPDPSWECPEAPGELENDWFDDEGAREMLKQIFDPQSALKAAIEERDKAVEDWFRIHPHCKRDTPLPGFVSFSFGLPEEITKAFPDIAWNQTEREYALAEFHELFGQSFDSGIETTCLEDLVRIYVILQDHDVSNGSGIVLSSNGGSVWGFTWTCFDTYHHYCYADGSWGDILDSTVEK